MSLMPQLFLLTAPLHIPTQLALCAPHLSPIAREVLDTVDCFIVNQDEGDVFCPLTIERVRTLKTELLQKPLLHDMRVVVIGALEMASLPAQQALLKMLEEPPAHVQILLTTQQGTILLPTIHSRCVSIEVHTHLVEPSSGDNQLPTQLQVALDSLPTPSLTLSDVMTLSEGANDQSAAKKLLDALSLAILKHTGYPSAPHLDLLQSCQAALKQLSQRVNTRLVVEHVLFHFVANR